MGTKVERKSKRFPEGVGLETLWQAIEATRSSFIVTDCRQGDDPIVYANQAFYDLTGYSRDEVIGRNCRFLQGKGTSKLALRKIRQALQARQHIQIRLKNYRKDGLPFWNDLIVSPVVNADGVLTHFVGFQLDVTDQVMFQERLQQSSNRLAQSNRELEQFTYAASHDLQEPLRMVSSYLQLIKERYSGELDDDADVFIGFATEGAERMQDLVNDLLSLSRVRTTGRVFKPEDMNQILALVLTNMQLAAKESGADIQVDPLPTLPVDRTQMLQLFQNLISNALKYRRADKPPVITVSVKRQSGSYVFSVKDNGIGIDPAYHDRIFGMFQRLHSRREYPGTGVGLAICSKIVERHGGALWVESSTDKGATFFIKLPISQSTAS